MAAAGCVPRASSAFHPALLGGPSRVHRSSAAARPAPGVCLDRVTNSRRWLGLMVGATMAALNVRWKQ